MPRMSEEKNAEIDPRFDRAFQRGFDPGTPVEEYVPPPLPRKVDVPAPEPARAMAATPATSPPIAEPAATLHSPAVEVETEDEPVIEPQPDASLARNPFLLFLGIISIALIAAGIWLFVRSGDAFNSAEVRSQGDYMSLTATIQMAPFIAILGGATAIGVLFVFAARWRRR
jgi:hypothetical protein